MKKKELLKIIMEGVETWNSWRSENPHPYPDLRGADLRKADLSRADLSGVDLSEADLGSAYLKRAYLRRADLGGAHLRGVVLRGANLTEANLSEADLNGADLSEANLNMADLSEADLNGAHLNGADLSEALLRRAELSSADLSEANLSGADLSGADFSEANLDGTNLRKANFSEANLGGVNLSNAVLIQSNLKNAKLTRCRIDGISAWEMEFSDNAEQQDLIFTPQDQLTITVDNLEVAQFIYLLLKNEKIRYIIDTMTSKVVLILGRFAEERKVILDALREELRRRNLTPIFFDFKKPASKDVTGTVETIARMARFVIADLTDPSSIPHELVTIVPLLRTTPVLPLRLTGSGGYSMFDDFKSYPWVLGISEYLDADSLLSKLSQVIAPANEMAERIRKIT